VCPVLRGLPIKIDVVESFVSGSMLAINGTGCTVACDCGVLAGVLSTATGSNMGYCTV
jgi:hypothetical protein